MFVKYDVAVDRVGDRVPNADGGYPKVSQSAASSSTDRANADEECEVCLDEEYEEPPALVPKPGARPSPAEVDRHNATHMPFRSWCAFCVAGKAKANAHRMVKDVSGGVNKVSIDYMFLSDEKTDSGVSQVDEESPEGLEDSSKGSMPTLALRDHRTKYFTMTVVPRKGPHPYAVRRLGEDMTKILGYDSAVIKSDQEHAIKTLKSQVRMEYSITVAEEESGVGDSESNGFY